MDRNGTGGRIGQTQVSRALVACGSVDRVAAPHRRTGGRPTADFLTQLIVGADPSLRPARLERTRLAAALYAQAARRA